MKFSFIGFFFVVLSGCTHYLTMDDPQLKPFAGMYQIDRGQYGIGPLPKQAKVTIFRKEGTKWGYDAMIQMYEETTGTRRHVAFRKVGDSYVWVGEDEECFGPARYETVDGTFNESLAVAYFHGAERQFDGLKIAYRGPTEI